VDDYVTEVIKIQGEFMWHSHADTDELFFVVEGELTIQLRHGGCLCRCCAVVRGAPGVGGCPLAEGDVQASAVEPSGVVNTGDAGGPLTAKYDDSPRRVSAPYE
jgi:hypothetical protein